MHAETYGLKASAKRYHRYTEVMDLQIQGRVLNEPDFFRALP